MRHGLLGLLALVALASVSGASGASVPPVSGLVVRTINQTLVVSSLSGQGKRPLTKPLGNHERRRDYGPTWSPDGSMIAFARWTPKQISLLVIRGDGSGLRRVVGLGRGGHHFFSRREIVDIHWSPDGSQLAYLTWNLKVPAEGSWETLDVASVDGSGSRRIALPPKTKYGSFFSLFGWTRDGSRVTYAISGGGSRPEDYDGPSDLMTTSADGTETAKVLTEYAIDQAAWLADGSLLYVRNCYLPSACQLELRAPGSRTSRSLTHFKPLGDAGVASETDSLPFMQLPSGEIIYTHGAKIYDFSPLTNATRTVGVARIPRKKHETCDALSHWVDLAGISSDGHVALIELGKWCDTEFTDPVSRGYRFALETGALTRMRLVTTNPAQIYLP
jgi:hypothetical protein